MELLVTATEADAGSDYPAGTESSWLIDNCPSGGGHLDRASTPVVMMGIKFAGIFGLLMGGKITDHLLFRIVMCEQLGKCSPKNYNL